MKSAGLRNCGTERMERVGTPWMAMLESSTLRAYPGPLVSPSFYGSGTMFAPEMTQGCQ